MSPSSPPRLTISAAGATPFGRIEGGGDMNTVYDFTPRAADGAPAPLAAWRGKALLIVNVASQCGFTPQYAGLQALQSVYEARGFSVLAFPCNQFGAQEPGGEAEICDFAARTYATSFPIFAKVEVNGPGADPLWTYLKAQKSGLLGHSIKWNFTKFLAGRDGRIVARYAPSKRPQTLAAAIERLL
jgi:glutathione peroxidase